jgi:hypothetical protein
MKYIALFLLVMISNSVRAQPEFVSEFIVGKYLLVGEALNSDSTYTGRIEIYIESDELKIKRIVNNQEVIGSGKFDSNLDADNATVLRISFTQNNIIYEQTCLWQSDLDNYARISCYLYEKDIPTNDPGLEVFFHDHNSE